MPIATILLSPLLAMAQNAATSARPAFEVVSVKPTQGQPVNSGFRRASPGSLNATNITVRMLIEYAYGLRDDQITGGPSWLDTDHFEIVAKPPEGADTSEAAKRLRTQTLLEDRFHLVFHRQTKELPVYILSVARNGPKGLRESTRPSADFVTNGHHLDCWRLSMAEFARDFLARQIGRTVTDKTGIAGNFDFSLDWVPDDAPADSGPSFLVALQEQLGLKLEQGKGPVEVMIIDRAEHPAAN